LKSKDIALQCPAAPPHWPDARVWGIAAGTKDDPQIVALSAAEPFPPEWAEHSLKIATPREIFRLCGTCIKCKQYWRPDVPGAQGDGACSLVQSVIDNFPEKPLQWCPIRSVCRWFAQEGQGACRVCPGIVTDLGELPQEPGTEDEVRFFQPVEAPWGELP
jgi:hypothetical protein